MTLLISEEDVADLLSIESTMPVIEEVFRQAGEGRTENPARFRLPFRKGFLQFGAAAIHADDVVGFKLWANFGSPLRSVWNFLFDVNKGELVAIVQAHLISKFRTSAVTALGVKYLSPPGAETVGIFGTGRQAEAQLTAVCAARPIKRAIAYSRNPDNRARFSAKLGAELGIEVTSAASPEQVVDGAEIIVTITKSETPVLNGAWLKDPALVIAAGANHWYSREIDGDVVQKAGFIVVDDIEQSKVESGDLLWPIGHGLPTWDQVNTIGEVVSGRTKPPIPGEGLILFKTNGVAIADVAISKAVYDLARRSGVGREIQL